MGEVDLKNEPASDKRAAIFLPWRMGRKVGRTVYAQVGEEESDDDVLIGVMDSRILAADVVASHNAVLASRPELPPIYAETIEDLRNPANDPHLKG